MRHQPWRRGARGSPVTGRVREPRIGSVVVREEIPLREEGNADGVQWPESSSPGGATAKPPGHHRGLSAGQVITGGTRARGSASRRLDTIARKRRAPG